MQTQKLAAAPAGPRHASTMRDRDEQQTPWSVPWSIGSKIDCIREAQTVFTTDERKGQAVLVFTTIDKTGVNLLYSLLAGAWYSRRRGVKYYLTRCAKNIQVLYILKEVNMVQFVRDKICYRYSYKKKRKIIIC